MKTRRFSDEVYGAQFVLVSDCTPAQFARFVWRHYDKEYELDEDLKGQCLTHTRHGFTVLIYIRHWRRNSPTDIATLAHEVFHAVEGSMEYHGVLHRDVSEAWAYYLDFVLRRCLELLK